MSVDGPGNQPKVDLPSVGQIASSLNKAYKSESRGHIFMTPTGFKKMNWLQAGVKWLATGFKVHLVSKTMITSIGQSFEDAGSTVDMDRINTLSNSSSQRLKKPSAKAAKIFHQIWKSITPGVSKLQIEKKYLAEDAPFKAVIKNEAKILKNAMADLKPWENLADMKLDALKKYLRIKDKGDKTDKELEDVFNLINEKTKKGHSLERLWEDYTKFPSTEAKQSYDTFKSYFTNSVAARNLRSAKNEVEEFLQGMYNTLTESKDNAPEELVKQKAESYLEQLEGLDNRAQKQLKEILNATINKHSKVNVLKERGVKTNYRKELSKTVKAKIIKLDTMKTNLAFHIAKKDILKKHGEEFNVIVKDPQRKKAILAETNKIKEEYLEKISGNPELERIALEREKDPEKGIDSAIEILNG